MNVGNALLSLRVRRTVTLLVPLLALLVYLVVVPPVPDLAAQATRAAVFQQFGAVVWWPGWFGGLELPTYSLLAPGLMATLGVAVTGAIAAAVSMRIAHILLRDSLRPYAASLVFAAVVMFNLVGGRITFLVGLAAAMLAVHAMWHHRWVAAGLASALAVLGSPLAGMFAGIVALAVIATRPDYRRDALALGGGAGVALAVLAIAFKSPGIMATSVTQVLLALFGVVLVLVACSDKTIRTGAIVVGALLLVCLVVPNPVGLNMTRMVWLLAGPLIVGYGHRPRKHVAVLTLLALVFPSVDLVWQLAEATAPSAVQSYYTPLLDQLSTRASAQPGSLGQRVEVLEPQSKGASRYVALSVPMARGWERQTDVGDNPIFYTDGALTPGTYHHWLHQLAVGWVAVPADQLDFASVDEAALIASGLPYLHLQWQSATWKLYRVENSTPLVRGATVTSVDGGRITMVVPQAGSVRLQVRWSNHLSVLDGSRPLVPGVPAAGCLAQHGQWTTLRATQPGTYVLGADFDAIPGVARPGGTCATTP